MKDKENFVSEISLLKARVKELESTLHDQRQMDQKRHDSEKVIEMIINNIPNQVFWKSRDLIYLGCNQSFAKVTGMGNPSEIIGKTDYDFQRDPAHADSYREWDKKIMDSGEAVIDIEESYHDSDGNEGTILTSKVPLKDNDGKVFGILGICTDITERKKMENDNSALIRDLKVAIAEVKTLHGLLPICSSCKKIRDDDGYWQQIESYISQNSDIKFSHGICQDCSKKLYPDYVDKDGNIIPKMTKP